MKVSEEALVTIPQRVLTTGAFADAKATLEPAPPPAGPDDKVLKLAVAEKWTTIPVVRGAYGGGTPLRVAGIYDIHSFGRLVTLGAEVRKYGEAPPGFVAFAKAPRFDADRYALGLEVWRDFRRRSLYDRDAEPLGVAAVSDTLVRVRALRSLGQSSPLKAGVNAEGLQESPTAFNAEKGVTATAKDAGLPPQSRPSRQFGLFPTLQYDDVIADALTFSGVRALARYGVVQVAESAFGKGEVEAFYFHVLPAQINLAAHVVAGASTLDTVYNQYFLGGLDSVRGFPDGIVHGTHAAWTNLEARYTPESLRFKYLWISTIGFVDAGGAGATFAAARETAVAAGGGGLRFAVPQIYRMMFRLDYAAALDGSGKSGLAAGFNHFFDPYKPL